MNHHVEIWITAEIPEDHEDAGHEAIVATKEGTHALVKQLEDMGMKNVKQTRRLIKRQKHKVRVPAQ